MLRLTPADKGSMTGARASRDERGIRVRSREGERGQAMVEFALIAPVFILLIAGIIQFGVVLNFWLDMQRIANQGARWAVVDAYPGCPRTTTPAGSCSPTLQDYLASEPIAGGLNPCVDITLPNGADVGEPVTVRLESTFTLVPIIGVGTINLGADATMRQEWAASQYSDTENTC
jgi:hypothetical protein